MYGRNYNLAPRLKGRFLWSQFVGAGQACVSMVYVAMFDEVDEGTAIFKCSNDVPVAQDSKFLGYEGLPSDFYLKLVGLGTKLIRGEILVKAAKNMENTLPELYSDKAFHGSVYSNQE